MSSSWWYGVALFPVVAVTTLLSDFGSRTFILVSSSGGDPNVAAGIASFVLAVASFWAGLFVALVVFGCLIADIRALGDDAHWSPSIAWSLGGLAARRCRRLLAAVGRLGSAPDVLPVSTPRPSRTQLTPSDRTLSGHEQTAAGARTCGRESR